MKIQHQRMRLKFSSHLHYRLMRIQNNFRNWDINDAAAELI